MKLGYVIPLVIGLAAGGFVGYRMKDQGRAQERRILYYQDPMHPAYRSSKPGTAPDCGMELQPVYADSVDFSLTSKSDSGRGEAEIDPAIQRLYGIRVVPAVSGTQAGKIRLFGRVEADETRLYSVEFGTDGYVKETHDDAVGTHVAKNQKLATVYSPEFLSVSGGYLAANERGSGNAASSKEIPIAASQNSASAAARADRLRNLGMSDSQIEEMSSTHKLPEDVYLVSPADGFILSRTISPGMRFERHTQLYTVGDLGHIWIMADAFGRDVRNVHVGMKARITLPETDQVLTAVVTALLPSMDLATRAVKVRLECDNPGFRLRPGMFVNVDVPVDLPPGVNVPADAIVDTGTARWLFVRTDASHFVQRPVHTGWRFADRVEVVDGLREGEEVVSGGTFLLDSETKLHVPLR